MTQQLVDEVPAFRVNNSISATVTFAPIVPHADRAAWEEYFARQRGVPSPFIEYAVPGVPASGLVPARNRSVYVPMVVFSSCCSNNSFLRFDAASDPVRNVTLAATIATRTTTFTPPAGLLSSPETITISLFAPVIVFNDVANSSRAFLDMPAPSQPFLADPDYKPRARSIDNTSVVAIIATPTSRAWQRLRPAALRCEPAPPRLASAPIPQRCKRRDRQRRR